MDDLEVHLKEKIEPRIAEIKRLHRDLTQEKKKIMQKDENISNDEKDQFIAEMEKIQVALMEADAELHAENFVADTAAVLQLAVMWWNKWSMDFPPNALAQIANDPTVEEDGKEAFCSINWIDIANDYIHWIEEGVIDEDHPAQDMEEARNTEFKANKLGKTGKAPASTDIIKDAAKAPMVMASRFLRDAANERDQMSHQHKRFAQLSQFVDYLQMLRDVLSLHTTIVQSRAIKYWNGPRIPLSNTIERAYQDMIQKYNDTGKALMAQMEQFPDEIQAGFHEPNPTKAETIKVRAQAIQRDLADAVAACGVLGFFFPGSPMWELQRRLRECGEYDKSDSFWLSLKPTVGVQGAGMVDYNALQMYLDADLVNKDPRFKIDGTPVTPRPSANGKKKKNSSPKNKKGKGKGKGKGSGTVMVNPMQETLVEESDDNDGDDDDNGSAAEPEASPAPRVDEQLSARKKADADLIFKGSPGWRSWIPESAKHLVTYDGQFIEDPDQNTVAKLARSSVLYPLFLWVYNGLKIYLEDYWNCMELFLYSFFLVAFYCKANMLVSADTLKQELIQVQSGDEVAMASMQGEYQWRSDMYMLTLIPNAFLMWIKLFKYIDVVPQMGLLIEVLKHAAMPVMIFAAVGLIPVVGLAFSYHAAYGQYLRNYETVGKSLNTLLRMTVGDFDFVELAQSGSHTVITIPMFWITTMLLVFVLVNIFVAIILGSYDRIIRANPDSNNSSEFVSMVIMQAKRTISRSLGANKGKSQEENLDPHILLSSLDVIEDETF